MDKYPNIYRHTSELAQATMQVSESTKTIEVGVKVLSDIIESQCEIVHNIKKYFKRPDINLDGMIEVLNDNKFITLSDLECTDKEEFDEHILPLIKDRGYRYHEIKKLRKLCYDPATVNKWKESEKQLRNINECNLLIQVPILYMFSPLLQRRWKFAWDKSAITASGRKQLTISGLKKELQALQDKDEEEIQAMKFVQCMQSNAIKGPKSGLKDDNEDLVIESAESWSWFF